MNGTYTTVTDPGCFGGNSLVKIMLQNS